MIKIVVIQFFFHNEMIWKLAKYLQCIDTTCETVMVVWEGEENGMKSVAEKGAR